MKEPKSMIGWFFRLKETGEDPELCEDLQKSIRYALEQAAKEVMASLKTSQ